jgi:hypothetical protein
MNNIRRIFYTTFFEGIKSAIPMFSVSDSSSKSECVDVMMNYIGNIHVEDCEIAIYGARFKTLCFGDVLLVGMPIIKKPNRNSISLKHIPYDVIYIYRNVNMNQLQSQFKTLRLENLFLLPTLGNRSNNPSGIQMIANTGDIHSTVYTPQNGSFSNTFEVVVNKDKPVESCQLEDLILKKTCIVVIN